MSPDTAETTGSWEPPERPTTEQINAAHSILAMRAHGSDPAEFREDMEPDEILDVANRGLAFSAEMIEAERRARAILAQCERTRSM